MENAENHRRYWVGSVEKLPVWRRALMKGYLLAPKKQVSKAVQNWAEYVNNTILAAK